MLLIYAADVGVLKNTLQFDIDKHFQHSDAIKSKRVHVLCSVLKCHGFIPRVALGGSLLASLLHCTVSQFILEWWLLHVFTKLLCKHIDIKIKISCRVEFLFHVALIMHRTTFLLLQMVL